MDATAVAAARGCAGRARVVEAREGARERNDVEAREGARERSVRDVLQVALSFGAAQALMPLLGWSLGAAASVWVAAIDHWIVFFVLGLLGAKMLRDAWRAGPREGGGDGGWRTLLALSLATSIDAFGVGLTLPLMHAPLVLSLVTIGVVTAVLSACGLLAGRRFGALLGRRLDAFGGVLLIALGSKILIEHLTA